MEKWRIAYQVSLEKALRKKKSYLIGTVFLFILSLFGFANLGYELFPKTDVGQMEILVRKESGTPLSTTEKTIAKMEGVLKEVMGKDLAQTVSNIGVFYDLPAAYTPNSGSQDAFIKAQLIEGHKKSTDSYVPI